MDFDTITLKIENGIGHITLRRPDNANALNATMAHELLNATIACDVDSSVRVVLLDAEGKMFCAGGDLGGFAAAGDDLAGVIKRMVVDLHGAISRLARMQAPVIASVQGAAAGAGFSLAMACDLVIAARTAKLTMAYTRAGLVPDGSSTFFLPRLIGRRRTLELMLLNPSLTAEAAHEWGLVTRHIAQGPTGAYAAAKRLVLASSNETLESQMELEAAAIAAAATGPDGREGVRAFLDKRAPTFRGQ